MLDKGEGEGSEGGWGGGGKGLWVFCWVGEKGVRFFVEVEKKKGGSIGVYDRNKIAGISKQKECWLGL